MKCPICKVKLVERKSNDKYIYVCNNPYCDNYYIKSGKHYDYIVEI